jgi:hypothetical protein
MRKITKYATIFSIFLTIFVYNAEADDQWKNFNPDCSWSLPTFIYPPHLIMESGSGKGASKWRYKLKSKDGQFSLDSDGFYHIPESELKTNETSYDYLWRELKRIYGSSITYSKKTDHVLLAVSIKNKIKTFHKIYIPNKNANGAGINSLIIKFSYSKHQLFDQWLSKIESSWKPCQ